MLSEEVSINQIKEDAAFLHSTTLNVADQKIEKQEQQPVSSQFDAGREELWLDKFSSQKDKIAQQKYVISQFQQELKQQREEKEQIIEEFTAMCQELKYRGMDEVEDLQTDIQMMRDHMKSMA